MKNKLIKTDEFSPACIEITERVCVGSDMQLKVETFMITKKNIAKH